MEESTEKLISERSELFTKTGQHQFTKALVEAELLSFNQRILTINNELQKRHNQATPAPKIEQASTPVPESSPVAAPLNTL